MHFPDLLSGPSRFARWPGWACGLVLALLLCLLGWGMAAPPSPADLAEKPVHALKGDSGPADPAGDDVALYKAMAREVRQGHGYYPSTARLLRENDYPLRPFITFRLPTLSWFLAYAPAPLALGLMCLLVAAVIIAWTVRLAPALRTAEICSYASLFIMMNSLTGFSPALIVFHEGWVALLVALSLALYRRERWWPSVLLGLLALMIRELALPYVLLMGALALYGRNWREGAAWALAALIFAVALCFHAQAVWAVTGPADPASPGWGAAGGWRFVAAAVQKSTLFNLLPLPITPLLIPFALLGWAGWADPVGTRAFLYLSGFAAMMMLFGRPDNFYWAVMITPVLFVGLIFAPAALRDLAGSMRRRRASAA